MNLKRLEFTLTTKCNSQCIHCQACASPLGNEVMQVKDAHNYLTEAVAVSRLKSFMIFGGEPMLYPDRTITIFKKAKALKIPEIEMLTNGVWGKDKQKAEKLAKKLKEAGLNTIGISVDAFHLPHIPLDYPRNAAQALLEAGIEKVTWNVALVESLNAANKYDDETRRLLEMLKPVRIAAHFTKIMPVGRALQNLRQYFTPMSLEGPCGGESVIGNVLKNPESICIEPSGEVEVCWHLAIGNTKKKPLGRIISEYEWRRNPTIKILVEKGPMGLLESVDKQFRKTQYVDKCHLCIEIRKNFSAS
ncbi:radical SAM protein [Candidatus Bathyarchaeota archaeon]|nr:radical SAM protein [Candidatus Bathyarchaeota archaeon]